MSNLTPEKRIDRNGKLVTKHVRAETSTAASNAPLPAPELNSSPQKHLSKADTKQRTWTGSWHGKHPHPDVVRAASAKGHVYGTYKIECSDAEAYDVLRVCHGNHALLLLEAGIRSKEDALKFFIDNGLDAHIEDNGEWVDQALARDIPAQHTLSLSGFYGRNGYRDHPQYLDALEANGVRVLRDIEKYYPTVPDRIMKGEISYDDIRYIGATRFAKAARRGPAVHLLRKIHDGTAGFDIDALKQIIIKYEDQQILHAIDPLTMAEGYGAEVALNLRYYNSAAMFLANFISRKYSKEDTAKIIAYNDDMIHYCHRSRFAFDDDDVFMLYDSGATVKQAVEGAAEGLTWLQIAAMAQSVPASVSSGWL